MAQKPSRGKCQVAASSSYNQEYLPNEECARRFNMFKYGPPVILESTVESKGLALSISYGWLLYRRLHILSSMENDVFKDWVRKFYCNMHDVE